MFWLLECINKAVFNTLSSKTLIFFTVYCHRVLSSAEKKSEINYVL